ncbi:MAG: hypothetical protein ACM3Q2_19545, partial [Syntrophothermus sp.]
MKYINLLFILSALTFFAFMEKDENPFLTDFKTPNGVPPFDKIKPEHYMPAFLEGIKENQKETEQIYNNPAAPTFENTIEALEKGGK